MRLGFLGASFLFRTSLRDIVHLRWNLIQVGLLNLHFIPSKFKLYMLSWWDCFPSRLKDISGWAKLIMLSLMKHFDSVAQMDAVIWKQTEVSFSYDLNPVAIVTVIEHRKRWIPLSISEEAQDQEQDLQEGHVGTRSKVSSWRMSRGRLKRDSQRKQNRLRDQLEKPRIRSVSNEKMMPMSEKLFQKEWRGMGRTEKKGVS